MFRERVILYLAKLLRVPIRVDYSRLYQQIDERLDRERLDRIGSLGIYSPYCQSHGRDRPESSK